MIYRLLLLWLCVSPGAASALDLVARTHSQYDLPASNGWSRTTTFFPSGAWVVRLSPAKTNIDFTLPLGQTLPAGTYSVWLKGGVNDFDSVDTVVHPQFRLGPTGAWHTAEWTLPLSSAVLKRTTNCVAGDAFSEITWRFNSATASVADHYWEGFALSSDPSVDAFGDAFYAFTPPTVPRAARPTGNIIPNSSFETGWQYLNHARKTPLTSNDLNSVFLSEAVCVTNVARTGRTVLRITEGAPGIRYEAYLSPIRMSRDLVTNTFSMWVRGSRPSTVVLQNLVGAPAGRTNVSFTWSFPAPAVSNVWTRYSTQFVYAAYPSREVEITIRSVATPSNPLLVDDVGLEEGSLTDWSPAEEVEFGLETGRYGNMFFGASDPPVLSVSTWNNATNYRPAWIVTTTTDASGAVVDHRTNHLVVAAGAATNRITIPVSQWGWYRVSAHDVLHPRSQSELQFIRAAQIPLVSTNSIVGTHNNCYGPAVATNAQWGFIHNRGWGPAHFTSWKDIESSSNSFTWDSTDYIVSQLFGRGQTVMATMWGGGECPPWYPAKGSEGTMPTNALKRYYTNFLQRYLPLGIAAVETRNEASSLAYTPAQYAPILDAEVAAIREVSSNITICAFGGATEVAWTSNVWALLAPVTRSNINVVSVHLYPQGVNSKMGAETEVDVRFREFAHLIREQWGKEVWNTETGMFDFGALGGPQVGYPSDVYSLYQSLDDEPIARSLGQDRNLYQILRGLGHGYRRHYHYDTRIQGYRLGGVPGSEPTLAEADDSLRASAAGIFWLKALIDPPDGVAWSTNFPGVEMYAFQRASRAIVAVFTQGKTNVSVVATNSAFGVFDRFGNVVQTNQATVALNRRPIYLVSESLGTNALLGAVISGSRTWATNIASPNARIDISPAGIVPLDDPLVCRWSALSATIGNAPHVPSNVLTRVRLEGVASTSDWSAWSESRIFLPTNVVPDTYRLRVQATDRHRAATNDVLGPAFRTQGQSPVRRATSAQVGTLILAE